jgi:hypothetical protein
MVSIERPKTKEKFGWREKIRKWKILCSHYKASNRILYLLSGNESRIKITYDVHVTHHTYVRGQNSGTKQNTI